jgi:hypothetical protein
MPRGRRTAARTSPEHLLGYTNRFNVLVAPSSVGLSNGHTRTRVQCSGLDARGPALVETHLHDPLSG